jgi:hypothetical protein
MIKAANKESSDKVDKALNLEMVAFRIDADLFKDFQDLAIVKELIVSALMREALEEYMHKQKRKLLRQMAIDLTY